MFKKIIALSLVILTLLGVVSCGKDGEEAEGASTSGTVEESPYLDTIPKYNGDGRNVKMLVGTQLESFYAQEGISDSSVDSAVYMRNESVESRYNVKLAYTAIDGNNSGRDAFTSAIRNSVAAGTDPFEVIVGQTNYCLPLATESCYLNLLESSVIGWENEWYHAYINDIGAINGRLYGASGDFVISQYSYAMAMLYNKGLYESQGFTDDLYQLVRDGKWTLEKFEEFAVSFEGDTVDEYYGILHYDHCIQGMVVSCGVDFVTKDADGVWSADDFYNDKLVTVYENLRSLFNDNMTIPKADDDNIKAVGKTLFYGRYVHDLIADDKLKVEGLSIGVLPFPKYDEEQKNYRTHVMRGDLFYVPINADLETSSILLEALNYETRHTVVPEYWDVALELRGSDTSEDLEMLELISENFYYDFAKYYEAGLGNFNWIVTAEIQRQPNGNLATRWGTDAKTIRRYITKIMEDYGGVVEEE